MAQTTKDTLQLKVVEFSYKKQKQKEPVNTIKLDSTVLAENSTISLAELINRKTTSFIKTYSLGGISTPSIRGTAANHTKIYWNNVPINSSSLGTMDLSILPVFLLNDIELQYSTAGLQRGSGSLGAGINLTTKSSLRDQDIFQFQQSIGSFGTYQTYAGINYGFKRISGSTKLYYQTAENNYTYRNTFLLNSPHMEQKNASFRQYGLMQQATYAFTQKSTLNFTYWYQDRQRNVPSPMFILIDSARQKDFFSRALLEYKFISDKQEVTALASYGDEELNYINPLKNINALSKGNKIFSQINYKRLINKKIQFSSQLTYGLDRVKIEDYKTDTTKPGRQQEKTGIFSKITYQPFTSGRFDLSARQELINAQLMPTAFTLSTNLDLIKNEKLSFFGSFGRNYNFPSLNDLYWIPGGNPALRPEKSWNADAGLSSGFINKKQREIVKASVTAFSLWVDDWIQWQPGSAGFWEAKNLRKVWSRGVEAKINADILTKKQTSLITDFSYSFTRSTNIRTQNPLDNSLNKQLIYIPLHVFRSEARINIKYYILSAEYNYNGYTYTNSDNSAFLSAYSLLHFNCGRKLQFNRLVGLLMLKINNVLNTSYQVIEWYAMPGRYFELTLKLNVKSKK